MVCHTHCQVLGRDLIERNGAGDRRISTLGRAAPISGSARPTPLRKAGHANLMPATTFANGGAAGLGGASVLP